MRAATTDDRARLVIRDGENLTAAREAFPNSMYFNQVWHVRTFMLDVDASSISLVLHEDREHAAVVDEGGKLGSCGTRVSCGTARWSMPVQ